MTSASRDRIIAIMVLALAGSMLFGWWFYRHRRPEKQKVPVSHKYWFGQSNSYSRDDETYFVTTTITGGTASSDSVCWKDSSKSSEEGQGHQNSLLGNGDILVTTTLVQHMDYSRDDMV